MRPALYIHPMITLWQQVFTANRLPHHNRSCLKPCSRETVGNAKLKVRGTKALAAHCLARHSTQPDIIRQAIDHPNACPHDRPLNIRAGL